MVISATMPAEVAIVNNSWRSNWNYSWN
jgi:hypothetical protein